MTSVSSPGMAVHASPSARLVWECGRHRPWQGAKPALSSLQTKTDRRA
ncbi:MAG: hypothetical protein LBU32_05930 [Clostridiales bacterium]|nr:hypothetical protein [Clostridiales bacterium]